MCLNPIPHNYHSVYKCVISRKLCLLPAKHIHLENRLQNWVHSRCILEKQLPCMLYGIYILTTKWDCVCSVFPKSRFWYKPMLRKEHANYTDLHIFVHIICPAFAGKVKDCKLSKLLKFHFMTGDINSHPPWFTRYCLSCFKHIFISMMAGKLPLKEMKLEIFRLLDAVPNTRFCACGSDRSLSQPIKLLPWWEMILHSN